MPSLANEGAYKPHRPAIIATTPATPAPWPMMDAPAPVDDAGVAAEPEGVEDEPPLPDADDASKTPPRMESGVSARETSAAADA